MLRRSSTYFYLIKRKTSTIYCRIVVDDEQKGRTTGQKIEGEEYWDQSTQRVKDSHPQSESINETLSVIENQVREAENTLISRHEPVTLESLLDISNNRYPARTLLRAQQEA